MMKCDHCEREINPSEDDFASVKVWMGLNNDQEVFFYLHLEDCVDAWLHEETIGGTKE